MKSAQTRQALSRRDDNVRNAAGTKRKGTKSKIRPGSARSEAKPLSAAQKAANVAAARKEAAAKARVAARQAAGRTRPSRSRSARPSSASSGSSSKIPSPTKRGGSTSSKQSRGSASGTRPESVRSGRSSGSSGGSSTASTRIPRPRASLEGRPSSSPAKPVATDAPRARAGQRKNTTRPARRVGGSSATSAAGSGKSSGAKRVSENRPNHSIFRSKAPSPNLLTKRFAANKFAAKHASAGRKSMIVSSRSATGGQSVKPGRSSMILPSSRSLLGRSAGAARSVLASGALHRSTGVLGRDLPTFAQRLAQSERSARRPRYGPDSSAAVDMGAAPGQPGADADDDDQFQANPRSLEFITGAPVPFALAGASDEFVSADQALWRISKQAQAEERKRVSIYGGALRKPMAKRKAKATAAPATRTAAVSPPSPPTRRANPRASRATPPNVPRKGPKTPRDNTRTQANYSTMGSAKKAPTVVASRKLVDAMLSPGAAPCSVSRKKRSVLSESRSARRMGSAARFSGRGSEKRGIGTPAQRVPRSSKRSTARGSARKAAEAAQDGEEEEAGVMDDAVVKLDFGGLAVTGAAGRFAASAAMLESTPEDDAGSDSDDNGAAALVQAAAEHAAPASPVASGAGAAGAGAAMTSPERAPPPIKLAQQPVAESWRSSLASPPPGSMSANSAFNAVGTLSSGRSELDLRASLASLPSLHAASSPVKQPTGRPRASTTAGATISSADLLPGRLLRSASLESASRLHAAMLVRGSDDTDEEVASIVSTSSQNLSNLRLSIESLHAGDEAAVMSLGAPLAPCLELAGEFGDANDDDARRVQDPVAAHLTDGPVPETLASVPQVTRAVSRNSNGGDNIVAVPAVRRSPTV